MKLAEDFGITVINSPKTPKLPLGAVPVAMVVSVFGCELSLGDRIDDLNPRDDLDRERQRRPPAGFFPSFVFKIELRGRRPPPPLRGADVIFHLVHQIRFGSTC